MLKTAAQLAEIANRAIADIHYGDRPAGLYQPIRYVMDHPGKRIRPVLCLATAQALGSDINKAIWPACAVEMFHNFTLVHDDVMDCSDLRRGRATVHVKWDVNTAILSGDTMLTLATQLLEKADAKHYARLSRVFNRTAIEVYEGQQYDIDFESRNDVTVAEYFEMIRLKTSVLLGCATAMGAIVADATEEVQKAFYEYAVNLGIAFQLRDDVLDTFGDGACFGKPIGGDIRNNKKTWLLLTALAEDTTGAVREALNGDKENKVDIVRGVYEDLGLPARAEKLVKDYTDKALTALLKASLDAEARQWFVDFADKMVSRKS